MDKNLSVELLCRLLFMDPTFVWRPCLETLFANPVFGPFLRIMFADPFFGPFLQLLFADPVYKPFLQKLFANNIFRPSLWTHLQTTFMNLVFISCL